MASLALWGILSTSPARADDKAKSEKTTNKNPATAKPAVSTGISQAQLAAQLALEGEKRRSPMLLLSAAEILGDLKATPPDAKVVKSAKEGAAPATKSEKKTPELSYQGLLKRAEELAQSDPQSRELVAKRIEQLRTRGLVVSQGTGRESVVVGGVTYKVIDSGVISPGQTVRLKNVRFEGGRPAVVLTVGDGDGDLDLWVYDGNSGNLIGSDTDGTSTCLVAWVPLYEGPFTIVVSNVGRIAERYVVLANW